jgi:D-alanyl-D-alanine carboxypeptidase
MAWRTLFGVLATMLVVTGCGGGSTLPPQQRAAKVPPLAQRLDADFAELAEYAGVPGAVAALVVDGRLVWSGAYGSADVARKRKMQPGTPMAFGSITKTVTASIALKLAEEGRLSLDDPVRRWLPEWRGGRTITVRRLLSQTAGVADPGESFYIAHDKPPTRVNTPADWLAALPAPNRAPVDTPTYANANYILAGLVLKRAARGRWRAIVRGLPKGLALQPDERAPTRPARGYWYPDGTTPTAIPTGGGGMVPSTATATVAWTAGGLAASAPAVAQWADGLLGGDALEPDSLAQMTTFNDGTAMWNGYGLGLARGLFANHEVWGHIGDIPGFHAELWHIPDEDVTLVAAWNDDRIDEDGIIRGLANLTLQTID